MTLWEFRCVSNGFRKFNSTGEEAPKPPSEETFAAVLDRYADH